MVSLPGCCLLLSLEGFSPFSDGSGGIVESTVEGRR